MDCRRLTTESEHLAAAEIFEQLWTDRDREEIRSWASDPAYHLFGIFDGEALVGAVGIRIETVLHHQRHAWLYDFVVSDAHRGQGYGSELLAFVESWAAEQDCAFVALASPVQKERVHAFYERRGYDHWGHVFEKTLD